MKPVETALLFVAKPTWSLERFCATLNARLKFLGLEFSQQPETDPQDANALKADTQHIVLRAPGIRLDVAVNCTALPAESFAGALESPLSEPFRDVLSETLFRHRSHILSTVTIEPTNGNDKLPKIAPLTALKLAHAAATLLCEWHQPAAIHWRQSNQILVTGQYLRLSNDRVPWVLFANARKPLRVGSGPVTPLNSLQLDEAIDLIGRPIRFCETTRPFDEIHAAALSFLRYTLESGDTIADGQTFGPSDDPFVRVTYIPASPDRPLGSYDLTAVTQPDQLNKALEFRTRDMGTDLPSAYTSTTNISVPDQNERTRSLAISYLMLLVMPPVGVLLLVINTVFGSNSWRTGVIATASVALALIVGAYTFLSYVGQETAVFIDTNPVESSVLAIATFRE